jgi:predicted dehydrogenase
VLQVEGHHSGPTGYKLKGDSWRATRVEAPGGGMTARGIHTLDSMLQAAGGVVTSVYAFSDKRKIAADVDMDDNTSMLLKFSNGVPLTPHGNVNITNANGLSLMAGLHSRAIRACSSSALYLVDCI